MTKKKRAKNEPTKGDLLAQAYRNRAAMFRVYEAAIQQRRGFGWADVTYWKPFDIRTLGM
jgi:hypothetical protein